MPAVQLVVTAFETYRTGRVYFVKVIVYVNFIMRKTGVPGVYPVLHNLCEGRSVEILNILKNLLFRNMLGKP